MNEKLPPSRTAPQFVIRFPDKEMRDHIRDAAEKNGRSMNAEIIARLEASFQAKGGFVINSDVQYLPITNEDLADAAAIAIKETSRQTSNELREIIREEIQQAFKTFNQKK